MKIQQQTPAIDFTATTINGTPFRLSDYKGSKILLSFYRNGACALCNLRVHDLITNYREMEERGLRIVAVFESSVEDMQPYVGKQEAPFMILSDPSAVLYDLYSVESSEEKVNNVLQQHLAAKQIVAAEKRGFPLIPQNGSNFFRMPADFLIDEDFIIKKWHYSDQLIDHITMEEIMQFAAARTNV